MARKKNCKKNTMDDLNEQELMDLESFSFDTEKEPATLLEAIDNVNATINGMVCMNCLYDASNLHGNNLDYLARRLHITPIQAVLFSLCVEEGPNDITFDDFSTSLSISKARGMALAPYLDEMVRNRLLYTSRNYRGQLCYNLPIRVIKVLTTNGEYEVPQRKVTDDGEFLDLFHGYACEMSNQNISHLALLEELQAALNENNDLDIVKKMSQLNICTVSSMLLLFFCDKLVNFDDDVITLNEMRGLFSNGNDFFGVKSALRSGKHELIEKGVIEFACQNGVADSGSFTLTANARETLLANFDIESTVTTPKGVTLANSIAPKNLFYSDKVVKQVGDVQHFLEPEKYKDIVKRMSERFNRAGLTCLFYGGPGTGKTETVYQLARQTGRDIMVVECSQIKDKWVGESEKNTKAIFERYRKLSEKATAAPILLFNEADALFGVRMTGAERSVDKMENTMQNIILQEMESLDGILIATTNLTENLDAAFERRFLYKVQFERPDESVRTNIWRQMLPELTDAECSALGRDYDLSGGQIENVARKFAIDSILHDGQSADRLSLLHELCGSECIDDNNYGRPRIGF